MVAYIGKYRYAYGVELISVVLPIAPSTYYRCKYLEYFPEKCSHRVRRYEALQPEVHRVWEENRSMHGARKVWKQLNRGLIPLVVERLMRKLELKGVRRGRRCRTTITSESNEKPLDLVNVSL